MDGEWFYRNPILRLRQSDMDMVGLWRLYEMYGLLPDPGGALDQPMIMLEAFGVMSAKRAELERDRHRRSGGSC